MAPAISRRILADGTEPTSPKLTAPGTGFQLVPANFITAKVYARLYIWMETVAGQHAVEFSSYVFVATATGRGKGRARGIFRGLASPFPLEVKIF